MLLFDVCNLYNEILTILSKLASSGFVATETVLLQNFTITDQVFGELCRYVFGTILINIRSCKFYKRHAEE